MLVVCSTAVQRVPAHLHANVLRYCDLHGKIRYGWLVGHNGRIDRGHGFVIRCLRKVEADLYTLSLVRDDLWIT